MEQQVSAPERVRIALAQAGIHDRIKQFLSTTRTAEDAARAIGTTVGQIVKSLLFLADGKAVLALVSGANQLDLQRLSALTGANISKADAAAVRVATGYAIGGVPPAGFPAPIPTYIDRDLMGYQEVWAAAGTPHHVFRIAPSELLRLTGGKVADLRARP
jgi:prolyl-tRNA editing enzyme YbaK/EbsC (Cys-tRNA(Pro) deacylase)